MRRERGGEGETDHGSLNATVFKFVYLVMGLLGLGLAASHVRFASELERRWVTLERRRSLEGDITTCRYGWK